MRWAGNTMERYSMERRILLRSDRAHTPRGIEALPAAARRPRQPWSWTAPCSAVGPARYARRYDRVHGRTMGCMARSRARSPVRCGARSTQRAPSHSHTPHPPSHTPLHRTTRQQQHSAALQRRGAPPRLNGLSFAVALRRSCGLNARPGFGCEKARCTKSRMNE